MDALSEGGGHGRPQGGQPPGQQHLVEPGAPHDRHHSQWHAPQGPGQPWQGSELPSPPAWHPGPASQQGRFPWPEAGRSQGQQPQTAGHGSARAPHAPASRSTSPHGARGYAELHQHRSTSPGPGPSYAQQQLMQQVTSVTRADLGPLPLLVFVVPIGRVRTPP